MNAPDPSLRRLSALASAIAGHPMEVRWVTTDAGARTDGRHILLSRSHVDAARTTVVIQALLVAAGALQPALLRALPRSRRVRSRYLRLEVARALIAHADRLPSHGWDRPVVTVHTDSPRESLSYARSRHPLSSPPPEWGVIHPKAVLASVRNGNISSTALTGADRDPEEQTSNDDNGTQVGRRRRGWKRAARRGRSTGQGVPADLHRLREVRSGRVGASIRIADAAPDTSGILDRAGGTRKRYPEWDCHARRLRPDWCTVVEVSVQGSSAAALQDVKMGAALSRVRLDHARVNGQLDGDSIDLDAAVRARIDTLSGHTPDERIYSMHLRRRTPIGVFVLIDMSGSLARCRPGARSVAELHRSATAVLLDSMQRQGDRTAAAAFRSFGRSRVEITPIKAYTGRFDLAAREDLCRLRPSGFTRMGAAIRFAGDQIRDAGTRRRLLVVITDGFPFDQGYEGAYAAQDTSHALDELFVRGVGTVCLAVGDLLHTGRLADVFGTAGFLHLNELGELQTRFPAIMHQALLHVENASRRIVSPRVVI